MAKLVVRRPMRFFAFIVAIVAVPALLAYLLLLYMAPLPETMVPDVIGLDEHEAAARLERMGLAPKVEARSSQSTLVTHQRPEPGKIVKTGRVVLIILGKSGAENLIPESVVVTPLMTAEPTAPPEIQIEVIPGARPPADKE